MEFTIIAVGRIKEDYLNDYISKQLNMIRKYAKISINEIDDRSAPSTYSPGDIDIVKKKEGQDILKYICSKDYVILLDVKGLILDENEFSKKFNNITHIGKTRIVFIIGGSNGVSSDVKTRADIAVSFSRCTFPHQLMRLVFLNVIYRSIKYEDNCEL